MKTIAVDIRTIKQLVYELQRSLCIVRNDRFILPEIDDDVQQWYALMTKMLVLIYQLSSDVHLRAIINCALDTRAIEETVKDLRAWNNYKSSDQVLYVTNVIRQTGREQIFVVLKNIDPD
jgi:hypothetical protein